MAGIGHGVIRRFQLNLLVGADREVDGNMERVGIVFLVGDFGNHAEPFAVDVDEATGEAFGRGGEQGEVQLVFLCGFIKTLADVTDDFQTEFLRFR